MTTEQDPMESSVSLAIRLLTTDDITLMEALLTVFGEAFDDVDTYAGNRPNGAYLRRLLGGDSFIALAALKDGDIVGGIGVREDVLHFDIPVEEKV